VEIRADLVVGANGRNSLVRTCSGLIVKNVGAPMDVLWMRLSKRASDPDLITYAERGQSSGVGGSGELLAMRFFSF
jgi:2-polyprenyl-6-methoxyphenol hydroxylase-like FAD-dependent oxidoreductase